MIDDNKIIDDNNVAIISRILPRRLGKLIKLEKQQTSPQGTLLMREKLLLELKPQTQKKLQRWRN
jgi:hypothetical protein